MANGKPGKGTAKEVRIQFRGSRLDARRLAALARVEELTESEVLRRLIADACRMRQATDPKGPWKELVQ